MRETMIRIGIVILGIALFSLGTYLLLTTTDNMESDSKVILIDITDPLLVTPEADDFKGRFGFQKDLWKAGHMRIRSITEFEFSLVYETSIPSANSWFSNEGQRIGEVNGFFSFLEGSIDTVLTSENDRVQSSIYKTVLGELKLLSSSNHRVRELYIFSDLREHSSLMSTYQPYVLKRLQDDPDSVRKQFESAGQLPELTGIRVHIIFQPKDFYAGKPFEAMARIYKSMLEDKGAVVIISNNL